MTTNKLLTWVQVHHKIQIYLATRRRNIVNKKMGFLLLVIVEGRIYN